MASKVEIFNMALIRVGSSAFIQDAEEQSVEAAHCRAVYENSLKSTLESLDWGFARKVKALADLGTPEDDWSYQYAYPSDCVKARRIITAVRTDTPPPFRIGINSDGSQMVINCDVSAAKLRYTSNVTNTGLFPGVFAEALSWKIGMEIAPPLTSGDQKTIKRVNDGFITSLANAHAVDMNEDELDEQPDASWIKDYE